MSRGTRADICVGDHGTVIRLGVDEFLHAKMDALAAHRTQFPVQPGTLPGSILLDLFGVEYFLPVQSLAEVGATGASGCLRVGGARASTTIPETLRDDGRRLVAVKLKPAHICRRKGLAVPRPACAAQGAIHAFA